MKNMQKRTKTSYLFHNMALFTVSNFVSKILVFLLVPFYTDVLTESEYGIADVMQATLLLAVPLLSMNAGEAALRFALEHTDRYGSILKKGLKSTGSAILAVIFLCCAGVLMPFDGQIKIYIAMFALLFACDAIYEFMLLYCQGTEKVQIMITGSVSCTILVIISNLYFLLVLKTGLYGYLFSQMISFAGAALLMFILSGSLSELKNSFRQSGIQAGAGENTDNAGNKEASIEKEMTHYGKSMLLYSTSSWVNNAIDRYYILFMLGSAQNGLYGVAYKIPAILQVFQRIFAQSFQMSATKSYKDKDSVPFFSNLYAVYNAVMVIGCAGILLFLKPIAFFMFNKGFFQAWILVPPLLMSVIFGALNGYLGSICLAYKDGKSMGQATGIGALVNIVLNYAGIMLIGSLGAAIATLISYFTMFIIAFFKTRKHVRLEVDMIRDIGAYMLLAAESVLTACEIRGFYFYDAVIVILLFIIYRKEFIQVIKKWKK